MTREPKTVKYNAVAMVFHWLIAALVIFMLWYGHHVNDLPKGSYERLEGFELHYSIGLTILLLTVVRLVWRITHRVPPFVADMTRTERLLARAIHSLFYVLLIVMPLAGWAAASTSELNVPIRFFDLFQWPWFPGIHGAAGKALLNEVFGELHGNLSWVILGLLALHAGAALRHALFLRNATLKRMLPGR